jgi:hypothetical protein
MGVLEQGRNRIRKEKLSIAIEGAGRGTPEQFSREGAREFIRRCSDFSLFIFLDNKIRKDEHRSLSSELNLEGWIEHPNSSKHQKHGHLKGWRFVQQTVKRNNLTIQRYDPLPSCQCVVDQAVGVSPDPKIEPLFLAAYPPSQC